MTMELTKGAFRLRLLESDDIPKVHDLHRISEVAQFNTLPIPNDLDETSLLMTPLVKENQANPVRNYTFVVEHSGAFMGLFGIKLKRADYRSGEVWFKYLPEYWGKGLGTSLLNLGLDYCFNDLDLHRVEAGCAVENIGSIRVMEKVGMIREGHCRESLPLATGWSDNYEYAILNTDPRK